MIRLAPRRSPTSRENEVRARAARAVARRAARRRHARRAAIAALAALAAGFASSSLADGRVWQLVDGESRAIEAIVVTGHERVDAREIARRSGVVPGSAIDAVDLAAVERAIEGVDWVRDATVHRAPNATLVVAIEERAAAALLLHVDSQSWFALEADGAPIAQVDPSAHATLPRLQASDALDLHVPSDDAQRALSLAGEFARRRLPPVEWIALPARRATNEADTDSGRDGFRAKLAADGAVVALGDTPSANQLDRLGELLAKRPDVARDAASIDLRFRDRAILRMREPAVDDAEAASTPEGEITLNVESASDEVGRQVRERVWMRALASSGALWIQRSRTQWGERGMARNDDLIIGLDIGTTKIGVIVAEATENGVDIVGIGTAPSRGLRRGVVVDIEATVESIKSAVEEAELMADCEITSVYAGIAGSHIRGINSHGVVAVKDREVRESDIKRVIDAAKAVAIPMDREVIHVIPQEFIIDDQDGIREPLGMSGVRLEAKIHIVTAAVTSAQNIVKCANKAGLNVIDIVLEPLASAQAVLAADERDLGVCMIDIGGGTTDIAVFQDGSIKSTSVLGLGGYHFTNDIAIGLRTPFDEAERIKKKFGVASPRYLASDDVISVPSVGGRKPREVSRKILCEIIEPRAEEILSLARQEIVKAGLEDKIPSGVVLTGGASALAGLPELAEEIFEAPVRRGRPTHIGGLQDVVRSPMYATGVGLVIFGDAQSEPRSQSRFRIRDESIFGRVKQRMRDWFYGDSE